MPYSLCSVCKLRFQSGVHTDLSRFCISSVLGCTYFKFGRLLSAFDILQISHCSRTIKHESCNLASYLWFFLLYFLFSHLLWTKHMSFKSKESDYLLGNLVLTTELKTWIGHSFTLYGGQFTFSTQLLTPNYLLCSPTDAAPQFL